MQLPRVNKEIKGQDLCKEEKSSPKKWGIKK
jgi:hypothetical protein